MDAVIEKWEEILQTVKSEYEVTDVPFNTWLKPLKVYEVDGKLITVVVPSEQAAIGVNYISKRYKIPLQVTICVLTGMEECEVRFVLEKDLPKKTEKNTSYDKQVQDTRYEEAHLNPKYTFDTFVEEVITNSPRPQLLQLPNHREIPTIHCLSMAEPVLVRRILCIPSLISF